MRSLRTFAQNKRDFSVRENLVEWTQQTWVSSLLRYTELLHANRTGQVNDDLYASLCALWIDEIVPQLARERAVGPPVPFDRKEFIESCRTNREPGLDSFKIFRQLGFRRHPFFIFQTLYRSKSARMTALRPSGRTYFVTVGEGFYVRARNELSVEGGISPLSLVPVVGKALSLGGSVSIEDSLKVDTGSMLQFNANMSLIAEENTLDLELKGADRCLVIRLNPEIPLKSELSAYLAAIPNALPREQMRRAMTERGLIVCDPQSAPTLVKSEKYYYIHPPRLATYMQDATDVRNRQFSLPLRGERDFLAFLYAGRSRFESPDAVYSGPQSLGRWLDGFEDAVGSVSSAAPGIYVDRVFSDGCSSIAHWRVSSRRNAGSISSRLSLRRGRSSKSASFRRENGRSESFHKISKKCVSSATVGGAE